MRKSIIWIVLSVVCAQVWAWTSPLPLPDVGEARIRVVGQNAQNYLLDFGASNASCRNQQAFDAKTDKMANVFVALDADIVALCEVEWNSEILSVIADAMNEIASTNVYTYVSDDLGDAEESRTGYMGLKAGFIYRSDKIEPVGNNYSPYYSSSIYSARLRIQAFKELATDEKFVLSMNHFKAKDDSEDAGESTRMTNVSRLLNKLAYETTDPDILIMGDLNAYMGEAPIEALEEAGYTEQLVRFSPLEPPYSYIYYGEKGLLDHTMANAPMASQVTGAQVFHINTGGYNNYRFSDHDTYIIGLDLGNRGAALDQTEEGTSMTVEKVLRNGVLYIRRGEGVYTLTGIKVER